MSRRNPRDGIYLTARDIPEVRQNEHLLEEAGRQLEQLAGLSGGLGNRSSFPAVADTAGSRTRLAFRPVDCRKIKRAAFPPVPETAVYRCSGQEDTGSWAVGGGGGDACPPSAGLPWELTNELWELLRQRNDQKPLPDKEELRYWEELLPECRVNAEQILKQLCSWGKLDILAARLRQEEAADSPTAAAVSSIRPAAAAPSHVKPRPRTGSKPSAA